MLFRSEENEHLERCVAFLTSAQVEDGVLEPYSKTDFNATINDKAAILAKMPYLTHRPQEFPISSYNFLMRSVEDKLVQKKPESPSEIGVVNGKHERPMEHHETTADAADSISTPTETVLKTETQSNPTTPNEGQSEYERSNPFANSSCPKCRWLVDPIARSEEHTSELQSP